MITESPKVDNVTKSVNLPSIKSSLQSPVKEQALNYNITPEEMWKCVKGSTQKWGIEGYEVPKKYYDYHKVIWEKKRAKIIDAHKKEWPPKNWPKDKESDKFVPPTKLNFIDEQIKLVKSFNDPKRSEELKQSLESRGTFKPLPKKELPNLRNRYLENEKQHKERREKIPNIPPWKENSIEQAKNKIEEYKKSLKSKFQKI